MAAFTVAALHLSFAFAIHIDDRLPRFPQADQLAQIAVSVFFVISGCVMIISSRHLFGLAEGSMRFWRRRAVRVLPPYWIATGLMLAVALWVGLPVDAGEIARSLVFAPYFTSSDPGWFLPFLWPGWTLFYELIFYFLFGCFVFAGRWWTFVLTTLALIALVVAGQWIGTNHPFAYAATRPILLPFIAGMAIGLAIEHDWRLPVWLRLLALAGSMLAFAMAPNVTNGAPLSFAYLPWAGLPAVLLCLAFLGGRLELPATGWINRAGEASYSLYLLHIPLAHAWIWAFMQLRHPGGSWGFILTALTLLIVLSLAAYKYVERPMIRRLNALLGGGLPNSERAKPVGS